MCVYSLFDWVPEQSDLLSKLLIELKGPKRKAAWANWARVFWLERVSNFSDVKKVVFIPSASTNGRHDHAFYFAEALAECSGGKFVNILKKVTNSHQKGKSRDERAKLTIQSHVKIAADRKDTLYVLVDDVLTTGSTAYSSYRALGSPINFEVWVLAKRSLSCGVSLDLL
jgi:predicted amidophosphoribosyltransferase